jgi:hypothetical protein
MKHGFWGWGIFGWEVTFKKSTSKIVVFLVLGSVKLGWKIECQIRSKYIIQKCSYLISLIDDKKKNDITLNIFYKKGYICKIYLVLWPKRK